jgi:transcription initiation factor TFIIF subunit alpha
LSLLCGTVAGTAFLPAPSLPQVSKPILAVLLHQYAHPYSDPNLSSVLSSPAMATNAGPPLLKKRRPAPNPLLVHRKPKAKTQSAPPPAPKPPATRPPQSFAQRPRSPTPEGEPTVYAVTTTKKALLEGFRHHVARLVARDDVNITDSQEYMRPVKLHRRDLTARPGQLQPGGEADSKSEAEDANLARIEEAKLVRQRQRDENAKLIAPSAANKKKPFMSKKKTEQVRRTNDTAEEQKRSQLRYEEALPWHLEDFIDKHTWVGAYEAALSDCHLMLVLEDDHFRVVPVEKWYKFREKSKFRTLDADQAEALLKKKVREPRWLMVHQKQDEMKKMIEKDAQRATGFFTRSGEKEEKANVIGAQREEPAPDADELDFNEDELFDDDEENPIFEGDEDEQKDAQNRIKREQRHANIFDLHDEKEVDEEEERKKMLAKLQKELEKGTRKTLLKREKNYVYEDSDDDNPYSSGVRDTFPPISAKLTPHQSDERDSDAGSDNTRKSGDRARNEPRSGQTTRGENTPSGRKKGAAEAAGIKRPGSPLASDASGNEAARKKPKLAPSRPRSTAASPDASGASGTESGAAAKKRSKAKAAVAAPRGAAALSLRGGAGSGSDSDARSARLTPGAGGKKGKSKAGTAASSARGTPAASRAQSPVGGRAPSAGAAGRAASRSASPAAGTPPRKLFGDLVEVG